MTRKKIYSSKAQKIEKDNILNSLTKKEIERIVSFEEPEPFEILGPHLLPGGYLAIRTFLPRAKEVWIQRLNGRFAAKRMQKIHDAGLYQVVFEKQQELFSYKIQSVDENGHKAEFCDPYAFLSDISDEDLYLIGRGQHYQSYDKFGAHLRTFAGVAGVHFSVWAPNAKSVSVIGNFNHWAHGVHPMTRLRFSGIWGLFIPGLTEGEVYKYAIKPSDGSHSLLKTDPYAFQAELRPNTASVVADLGRYAWKDRAWLETRKQKQTTGQPVSIYEVHLGSWKRDGQKNWEFLDYRQLAHELVDYVKKAGYSHIELLPVTEHPLDQSWGYQVVNYYAPTSRFGTPDDFMYFVDYCHQHAIGVILDWVPAHFPKDPHGLAYFDGTPLYAYDDWKKAEHRDWGTLVFDYGKKEVRNFLISSALFWLDKYHLDGLRVDAVASMLYLDYSRQQGQWEPNCFGGNENLEAVDFLKEFNETVHARFPDVLTIAEESTAWPGISHPVRFGGIGFNMKWNMGWMHDSLEYFSHDPVYRKYHQGKLTFSLAYAFSEKFVLPVSHDEVVHGKRSLLEKMPGDDWQKFANVRLFYGWMFGHPGKKLLFMGNDLGQRREWNCEQSIDWHLLNCDWHNRLNYYLADLQKLYKGYPVLYEMDFDPQGFEWIDFTDADASVVSFIRWAKDRKQCLVFVFNMTPVVRMKYRIGAPFEGRYSEVLNSDAVEYGGSGIGNSGEVHAENTPWHRRSYSLNLNLPPLGVVVFSWGLTKEKAHPTGKTGGQKRKGANPWIH
ncbi:MAG: 1,4-alpha-glucan branching protein GlgB [Candidatus Omnitrophica bacterium]|nr:1,4-alpha-glucan branching protein GlgB [Candidatus Omnitrophota bacterium]